MPTYLYKARDVSGKLVRGTIDAVSGDEVVDKLRNMGYMATYVGEARPGMRIEPLYDRLRRISAEEMVMFYLQLSNMINAGIPIMTGLDALHRQIGNRRLRDAVGNISRDIEAGDSLSEALAKYPRTFPGLFVSMVKAGEASGKLDTVLARYAEFFESQEDLKQKIQGALFYPMILLAAGLGVMFFIVTFVIPQFAEIFMKTGVKLPLVTLILYKVGILIKHFWYAALLAAILCWLGVKFYAQTERGRLVIDKVKLRLPVFGPLLRKAAISRFARTLGTLTGSGVPILQSLDITKDVIGNEVLARVIGNVRSAVERGEKIAGPLKISEEFPQDAVQMISAGEESGTLDQMLDKISDFYDMSLGYSIKKLTTIIEPIFLAVMGCMVGFIMASMLLPIFDMIKLLRH